jgi:hypothetical protein
LGETGSIGSFFSDENSLLKPPSQFTTATKLQKLFQESTKTAHQKGRLQRAQPQMESKKTKQTKYSLPKSD